MYIFYTAAEHSGSGVRKGEKMKGTESETKLEGPIHKEQEHKYMYSWPCTRHALLEFEMERLTGHKSLVISS